jgi:hypothetical protein
MGIAIDVKEGAIAFRTRHLTLFTDAQEADEDSLPNSPS